MKNILREKKFDMIDPIEKSTIDWKEYKMYMFTYAV